MQTSVSKSVSAYMSQIGTKGGSVKSDKKTAQCRLNLGRKHPNILLTFQGKTQSIPQWSEQLGINRGTLYGRYVKGLPPDKVLAPVTKRKSKKPIDEPKPL